MSKSKLVIQPIRTQEEHEEWTRDLIIPELPIRDPFMLCLVGMRGSGKSTLIANLMRFFNGHFRPQDTILITPSLHTDAAMRSIPADHKFDAFRPELIECIIMQQKLLVASNRFTAPSILLILDDCITERSFERSGIVELLGYRGRHLKISCIFSVQKYSAISRGIRLNCTHYVFFKPSNQSEMRWLLEEHSDPDRRAEFKTMAEFAWKGRKTFLFIDYVTLKNEDRFRKNLDEPIGHMYLPFSGPDDFQLFDPIDEKTD